MNIQKQPAAMSLSDFLQAKAGQKGIPLSGTFELSPVCNLSCRMCYVRKTQQEVDCHSRAILTLEQWLDIARQMKDAGTLYLLLTGGEPLLWPRFWELYEQLVDMGFLVSINSNGTLINDQAVERFLRRPPRQINITLYGAGTDSYRDLCGNGRAFTAVEQALEKLQTAGIPVKLNCSVTPQNGADMEKIIRYAKDRDLVLSVTTYMFPPIRRDPSMVGQNERFTPEESARYQMRYLELDRGPEAYRNHLESILRGSAQPPGLEEGCIDPLDGQLRCRAGKTSFWISWDGWMMACGMIPKPQVDLKEVSFLEGWQQLREEAAKIQLSGVCSRCPSRGVCHPCAAIACAETGECGGIPQYMCQAVQEMYRIAQQTLQQDCEK